jgi:GT2 family glycosyltransferase
MMRIAALLTCHNRCRETLACLRSIYGNVLPKSTQLDVFLVDDGSTDGTSDQVRTHFSGVRLLHGDGTLFWNKGMHCAFGAAIAKGYDYYLWVNDDTLLFADAIDRLLSTTEQVRRESAGPVIMVGSTRNAETGEATYGGRVRRRPLQPLWYDLVIPEDRPLPCDTMNGNCVLIPSDVASRVGNLDPTFTHAIGDYDYGLRASKAGVGIWVAPGFVGTGSRNPVSRNHVHRSNESLRDRLRRITAPKNFPLREWWIYTYRHAGLLWILHWLSPYTKEVLAYLGERTRLR